MPKSSLRDRLQHILDAIGAIDGYTAGKSFENYRAEAWMRDAVERNLQRLSEAARFIPPELRDRHASIDWRSIAGIGNILRHDYPNVIDEDVWRIVRDELSALRQAVLSMMAEANRTKGP